MDVDRFDAQMRQHLVRIVGTDSRTGRAYDHFAFVPPPLPDRVALSQSTWMVVAEVSHALGQLLQAGRQVPNPSLFRRPTIRREAQSTSALEGTYALLEEVMEADVAPDKSSIAPAVREVANYVTVADAAISAIR